MPTPYVLVSATLLQRLMRHLPAELAMELDTSQHETGARPADDLREDPEVARRLELILDPAEPLSVPRLLALNGPPPALADAEAHSITRELAQRSPRTVIANLTLYAQAGMPPVRRRG